PSNWRIRSPKSPPTPVHSTKVSMHTSRMVAIQNFWYLRKLVNGLKAMVRPQLRSCAVRAVAGAGLDTARSSVVWVIEVRPKIAIVASLRGDTTATGHRGRPISPPPRPIPYRAAGRTRHVSPRDCNTSNEPPASRGAARGNTEEEEPGHRRVAGQGA